VAKIHQTLHSQIESAQYAHTDGDTSPSVQVKLNVRLVTYNHAPYIEECIKSILMQKTNFTFNVIVADDFSTDGSLDIIKRYAAGSNIEFVYLESKENLGPRKNGSRSFAACNAEYIATMEGDDFWTDPLRLQKHVDFLDNHLECSMSFNKHLAANYNEGIMTLESPIPQSGFMYLTAQDIIRRGGPNASTCVYRKSVIDKLSTDDYFWNTLRSDWTLSIMAGTLGLVALQYEIMNVYRVTKTGMWSGLDKAERKIRVLKLINAMDGYTAKKFTNVFEEVKSRMEERETAETAAPAMLKQVLKVVLIVTPPIVILMTKALLPRIITEKLQAYLQN